MNESRTRPTGDDVDAFLAAIPDPQRRADCMALVPLLREATGSAPRLWGNGIVGFGEYHYRYASGREGDWFLAGFAPRKGDLTLYVFGLDAREPLLARLGRHRRGRACLYVKRLADLDLAALRELVAGGVADLRRLYPA